MPTPNFIERYNYLLATYTDPLDILIFVKDQFDLIDLTRYNINREIEKNISELDRRCINISGIYLGEDNDSEEYDIWYATIRYKKRYKIWTIRSEYLKLLYDKLINIYNSGNDYDESLKIDATLQPAFDYLLL